MARRRCAGASMPAKAPISSRSWPNSRPRAAPTNWARSSASASMATSASTRGVATSWATRDAGRFRRPRPRPGLRDAAGLRTRLQGDRVRRGALAAETYLGATRPSASSRRHRPRPGRDPSTVLWYSDLGFTRIADTRRATSCWNSSTPMPTAWSARPRPRRRGAEVHGRRHPGGVRGARATPAGAPSTPQRQRAGDRRAEPRALGGGPAGDQLHRRPARGRGPLGQYRQPDRLDFTVIGPAVNEASRIQAMCRSLDQPILISEASPPCGEAAGAPCLARPLRAARRRPARGAVHPRSDRGRRRRRRHVAAFSQFESKKRDACGPAITDMEGVDRDDSCPSKTEDRHHEFRGDQNRTSGSVRHQRSALGRGRRRATRRRDGTLLLLGEDHRRVLPAVVRGAAGRGRENVAFHATLPGGRARRLPALQALQARRAAARRAARGADRRAAAA